MTNLPDVPAARTAWRATLLFCMLAAVVLAVLCLVRWRAPASGAECQHMQAAQHLNDTLFRDRRVPVLPLLHWNFALGNTSLAGNALTLPLLCVLPGRASVFWFTMILISMAGIVWISVFMSGIMRAAQPEPSGQWYALAGLAAALIHLFSPLTLITACSFTAAAPAALCMCAALWAYRMARQRATPAAWLAASSVVLASWCAKPEWAVIFIPAMLVMYCVDEWAQFGWRACAGAVCTMAGIVPLALFTLYPWRADSASLATMVRVVYLAGVWLLWLHAGLPSARRAVAFALPVVWGVCTWLALFDNGTMFLNVVRQQAQIHNGAALVRMYVLAQWSGTPVATLLLGSAALAGAVALLRRWPGLLSLGALLGYATVRMPLAPQVQALTLHIVFACCAGTGLCMLGAWAERMWRRPLAAQRRLTLLCAVLAIAVLPGVRRAARDDIVPADMVTFPVFDRARTGWHVLAQIVDAVPHHAACSYAPATPSLSHLTLATYAQLYAFGWDVQAWPQDLAGAAAKYMIIAAPGTGASAQRYFQDPGLAAYCAAQRAALDADPRYHLLADNRTPDDSVQVRVYEAGAD